MCVGERGEGVDREGGRGGGWRRGGGRKGTETQRQNKPNTGQKH